MYNVIISIYSLRYLNLFMFINKLIMIDIVKYFKTNMVLIYGLEEGKPKVFCGCPCHIEIIIIKRHKYDGIPKYILGHVFNTILRPHKRLDMMGDLNPAKRPEVRKKISIGLKNSNKRKEVVQSDEYRKKQSESHIGKISWFKDHHHPEKSLIKMRGQRLNMCGKNNPKYGKLPSVNSTYGRGCYYDSPLQNKVYLRSSYELAYAQYLDFKNILWMYEMETFNLGDTTYTLDFFLPKIEQFIEIKGYMRSEAQDKINKFLEQYSWNLKILYKEDLINLGIKV